MALWSVCGPVQGLLEKPIRSFLERDRQGVSSHDHFCLSTKKKPHVAMRLWSGFEAGKSVCRFFINRPIQNKKPLAMPGVLARCFSALGVVITGCFFCSTGQHAHSQQTHTKQAQRCRLRHSLNLSSGRDICRQLIGITRNDRA